MGQNKPIHTVPDGAGRWINRTEGAKRGFAPASTKKDAEAAGRDAARRRHVEHISHRENGTIGERRSYGNDPYPPKG